MEALIADALPLLGGVLRYAPSPFALDAPAVSCGNLAVSSIDTIAGLEGLASEWQALESSEGSSTTPFQTYRFHREWVRHFQDADTTFRVVTVRSRGELVLILPLAIRRTSFGSVAGWMGDPILQYGDAICRPYADPTKWLDAALADLKDDGEISVLKLNRVRSDSAAGPWIKSRMSPIGAPDQAIGIDLSAFSEHGDYARARPTRAARNRKRSRQMQKIGSVNLRVLDRGPQSASLVSTAIEMKKVWLEKRGQMGRAFADDRMRRCLEALLVHSDDKGKNEGAVVCCLEVDGRPASIEYAFRHNSHHCAFLGAFDPELSRHSPGQVQMQHTIEWCIEAGTTVYDLMAPGDTYKQELGNVSVEVQDYSALLAMSGLPAALWTNYGPRSAKAAFELLPRGVRSTIRARLAS